MVESLGSSYTGLRLQTARRANYRATSPTRKRTSLEIYRRPMPRVLGGSYGAVRFLISEVPL